MPDTKAIPDLTFPMVKFGPRETPWDLKILLYQGGAGANAGKVGSLIAAGALGAPLLERLELVQQLHEAISGKLVAGGSRFTPGGIIEALRTFFGWAEQANHPLGLQSVTETYSHWTDALLHRVRAMKDLSMASAYDSALRVSNVLSQLLFRATPLIQLCRITKPARRKSVQGVKADKQNLAWTFAFGHLLQDVCDGLSLEAIRGPLPIRISLRSGGELVEWSKLKPDSTRVVAKRDTALRRHNARLSDATRAAYSNDGTLRTRHPLTNLRIEAELLMFIGQTGMNLGQAHKLKLRDFFYSSDIDGYKVGDRKNRRGGEVLFEIYKEYRAHFERYLAWRRELFAGDTRLFPLYTLSRIDTKPPQLSRTKKTCKNLGVSFVVPSALRSTRINWLLRRSGDADLTAEMAQHTKETLLTVYERPSLQRAIGETMRFWAKNDPALARTIPVAPGVCTGEPLPVKAMPVNASPPDCVRASGCLWCEHHRDIDSQDYIWSLGCFRHLKIIEVSKYRAPEKSTVAHPADCAVQRLSDKLRWFKESNALRRSWVEESLVRIEEGSYHPDWSELIESVEGGTS